MFKSGELGEKTSTVISDQSTGGRKAKEMEETSGKGGVKKP